MFGTMAECEEMEDIKTPFLQTTISTRTRELFLDTNGACFLCHKQSLSREAGCNSEDKNEEMSEVSLRNICRFLEINSSSILMEALEVSLLNESSSEPQKDKCDFSVLLCSACSSVAEKLSKLLRQVELARMRINHQLYLLNHILHAPRDHPQSNEETSENSVETRLVDHLRRVTRKQCSAALKNITETDFPRVLLHRSKFKIQEDPSSSSPSSSNEENANKFSSDIHTPISSPNPLKGTEETNQERESSFLEQTGSEVKDPTKLAVLSATDKPQSAFICDIRNSGESSSLNSVKEMVEETCKSVGFKYNRPCKCPFCKKRFKAPIFKMHLVNLHPEQYLRNAKLANTSIEEFKNLCVQVLSSETNKARDQSNVSGLRDGLSGQQRRVIQCLVCDTTCSNGYIFRYHATVNHSSILEEKLVHLQVSNNNNEEPVRKINPKKTCSIDEGGCGRTFSSSASLYHHKRHSCPKREASRSGILSIQNKCSIEDGGCGRTFSSSASLYNHKRQNCPKRKASRSGILSIPNKCSIEDGGCGRIFSSYASLYNHKRQSCPEMKARIGITSVRMKCSIDDGGCGQSFSSYASLYNHKRHSCPKMKAVRKKTITCSIDDGGCGRIFSSSLTLYNHKNGHCPKRKGNGRGMVSVRKECSIQDGGCGRTFSSSATLYVHSRNHCPKRRGRKRETTVGISNELVIPNKIEQLIKLTCKDCEQSFDSEMELWSHEKSCYGGNSNVDPLGTDFPVLTDSQTQNMQMEQDCTSSTPKSGEGTPGLELISEDAEDSQDYNEMILSCSSELNETSEEMSFAGVEIGVKMEK